MTKLTNNKENGIKENDILSIDIDKNTKLVEELTISINSLKEEN